MSKVAVWGSKPRGTIRMETMQPGLAIFPLVVLVAACCLSLPATAGAVKKVYSPIVGYRELEVEARGNLDLDEGGSQQGLTKQKYAVGYGLFERLFVECYGEIEKEDAGQKLSGFEIEARYQVFERGEHWLDVGVYTAYDVTLERGHADKLETKLLLQKESGPIVHVANLAFDQAIGTGSDGGLESGLAWSSRYRWHEFAEPGLELHSEFGKLRHLPPLRDQDYLLGPVIYGELGHVQYDLGFLFGLSTAAKTGVFKWVVEYEMEF